MLIDRSQRGSVTTEVVLEECVTAPVSRGQRLGTLTVRAGQQVLSQIPLVAEEPVPKLSWAELFGKVLRQIAMAKPV
jgi:D-alanyl-D-alanine carboxypeptidase (penicillin-binding protein 5/6)